MRTTVHRSIPYPGLLSLARQELAIRLDYAELRQREMPGGRGSSLGCGPGGRLWSAISRTLMTLLGRRTRVVVPIAIVRFVSFFGRPGDLHRLADRPRGPTISLRSSANRAWLEGLKAWMQSGAVCTPPVSGGTEPGELPSPYAAHRPLESSRRAAPRPQSSHHFHHVGRDRWDAASSSQRPDRRHLPR
jgi:hypothetical protein